MKNSNNIINVFKPRFRSNEVLANIRNILESGWTGIGNKTDVFEKNEIYIPLCFLILQFF